MNKTNEDAIEYLVLFCTRRKGRYAGQSLVNGHWSMFWEFSTAVKKEIVARMILLIFIDSHEQIKSRI